MNSVINNKWYFALILILSSVMESQAQSGVLDPSFQQDGIAATDIETGSTDLGYSGLRQPDGRILLTGFSTAQSTADYAIVRLLEDGSPDMEFGQSGIVLADFNQTGNRSSAIALQADGKIVLAGSTDSGSAYDVSLLRLWPDGTPDSTFGTNGWVLTDLGTSYETANAVAVQPDGKIIAAGRKADGNFSDFMMIRYLPDGQLDSDFGDQGIVSTNFREEDSAESIAIQPDGKIILGGFSSVSANGDFALARYNPDGTLDKLFGNGGKVLTDLAGNNESDYITSMVLMADGRILTAGNANNSNLTFTSDAGIARYESNGQLDLSFGLSGVLIAPFGSKTNVNGLTMAADGKILICGTSDVAQGSTRWFISRFLQDGGLDISFGTFGLVTTNMQSATAFAGEIWVQPDSKIVAVGTSGVSPDFDITAARYFADFRVSYTAIPVSCYGSTDGKIIVDATGGIAPLLYSINGGIDFQESNAFTDLAPGSYVILIQDNDGQGNTGSIGPVIIENAPVPPPVNLDIAGNTITFSVGSGGSPPFQYSVDGVNFSADPVFTDLADGIYPTQVVDANGCVIFEAEAVIETSAVLDPSQITTIKIMPNPSNGLFQMDIRDDLTSFDHLGVTDMTGRMVYTRALRGGIQLNDPLDLQSLQNGSYTLHLYGDQRHAVSRIIILH